MAEYIEREKTIRDLEKLCADGKMIGNDNSTYIDFADAIEVVAEQPTADVQEVRHGKWVNNAEDVYWGNHFTRKHCSECGNEPEYREGKKSYILSNYCRNCGAKMDKE